MNGIFAFRILLQGVSFKFESILTSIDKKIHENVTWIEQAFLGISMNPIIWNHVIGHSDIVRQFELLLKSFIR